MKTYYVYALKGLISKEKFLAINHDRRFCIRKTVRGYAIAIPAEFISIWKSMLDIKTVKIVQITAEDIRRLQCDHFGAPLGSSIH